MWLIYKEQTDKCKIMHGRNGREYRMPEVPRLSVDGYCPETKIVYEFYGCYYHGHRCMPYRDTATLRRDKDTLAQRYEQTMTRLEQITKAGYEVEIMWECEFDRDILSKHPELGNNPLVQYTPLNPRDALYGGRTKAMSLRKKIEEGQETIEYCVSCPSTRTYANMESSP
jgi:G:T-mismatch repair DNA endonuclease (very short patch repair protein)